MYKFVYALKSTDVEVYNINERFTIKQPSMNFYNVFLLYQTRHDVIEHVLWYGSCFRVTSGAFR